MIVESHPQILTFESVFDDHRTQESIIFLREVTFANVHSKLPGTGTSLEYLHCMQLDTSTPPWIQASQLQHFACCLSQEAVCQIHTDVNDTL